MCWWLHWYYYKNNETWVFKKSLTHTKYKKSLALYNVNEREREQSLASCRQYVIVSYSQEQMIKKDNKDLIFFFQSIFVLG